MFFRMLKKSFLQGKKNKLLAIVTIAFGATLASAVLSVSLDIGDKVNKELKSYGANLIVKPKMEALPLDMPGTNIDPLAEQRYISEDELPNIKMIFWRHNILGFVPSLSTSVSIEEQDVKLTGTWFNKKMVIPTGETLRTGVKSIKTWWDVNGNWPGDNNEPEALIQQKLAQSLNIANGDKFTVTLTTEQGRKTSQLKVVGIVSTGSNEGSIFVPLNWLQEQLGKDNQVQQVEVSALTTPENALARKAAIDLESLSSDEFETWYCTAYVDSIAYQIEEVIPGVEAKQLRQVAQSEGKVLSKIQLLMALLTVVALLSSILGISNLMTASVLERSKEIGLYKALGASNLPVIYLFMAEALLIGLAGGIVGYGIGFGFAQIIGKSVFSSTIAFKPLVIPMVLMLSTGVGILGTISAMGTIVKLQPAEVLHGR